MVSKSLYKLHSHLPSFAQALVAKYYSPALHSELCDLLNAKANWYDVENDLRPFLILPDGVNLVGEIATQAERQLLKHKLKRLGLPDSHAKVAIDYVVRYKHPHMAIAYDTIDSPLKGRRYYHPQHRNLAQECQGIRYEDKVFLKDFFYPRKDWFVVDVGCYLGYGSLSIANIVTQGKIVSIEAIHDNYQVAVANRFLNGVSNWEILNAAIWDKSNQELEISRSSRQANAIDSSLVKVGVRDKVSTISISAISSKYGAVIDLLSLTVNGAEVEAIRGMLDMQKRKLPRRILCPGWYAKDAVFRSTLIEPLLVEMGYEVISTPGNFLFAWLSD